MEHTLLVQDIYDALRIRSGFTEDDQERDAQLASYIEVMTGHGCDTLDRVKIEETGAHNEGEPTKLVGVTFATPSDMWRSIKRNINKGGFFLQVSPFAPMNSMIQVHVTLEDPRLEFTGQAKVIFVNPQAGSGRPMGIGIKFLWDDDKRALLKRFLKAEIDPAELAALGAEAPPAPTPEDGGAVAVAGA